MDDLILTKEEFIERYVRPAAKGLADKMKRNEPLTDIERRIVEMCFGLPDDPEREFIVIPD